MNICARLEGIVESSYIHEPEKQMGMPQSTMLVPMTGVVKEFVSFKMRLEQTVLHIFFLGYIPVVLIYVPFRHIMQLKQHLWIPSCFFAYPSEHSGEQNDVGTCKRHALCKNVKIILWELAYFLLTQKV